jgi:hypothetical protein
MTSDVDEKLLGAQAERPGGGSRPTPPVVSSAPRVRTTSKQQHEFIGTYKGCTLYIRREDRYDPWYITVTTEGGGYLYDGWWTEPRSEGRIATIREAIVEACRGSMLWQNTELRSGHDE